MLVRFQRGEREGRATMGHMLGHLIGWYVAAAYGPGWLLIEVIKKWINGDRERRRKIDD